MFETEPGFITESPEQEIVLVEAIKHRLRDGFAGLEIGAHFYPWMIFTGLS